MIQALDLTKKYETASGTVKALDGVCLHVQSGERVALLGRSGSGKTTLLNMLAGLDRPTSGSLVVGGKDLSQISAAETVAYRSKHIGVVFQSFQLIPQRTALQNVELPMIVAGVAKDQRQQRAKNALQQVGLSARLNHRPFQLSGGEKQRVAIARATINKPPILLADEPTGNLDSASAKTVMNLLTEIADTQAITLVIVTHDKQLAREYSDRVIEMADGQILENTNGTEANNELG